MVGRLWHTGQQLDGHRSKRRSRATCFGFGAPPENAPSAALSTSPAADWRSSAVATPLFRKWPPDRGSS